MSYILDALRKAERDRPRGTTRSRIPAAPAPAPQRLRHWSWVLGAAIVTNAALLLLWTGWLGSLVGGTWQQRSAVVQTTPPPARGTAGPAADRAGGVGAAPSPAPTAPARVDQPAAPTPGSSGSVSPEAARASSAEPAVAASRSTEPASPIAPRPAAPLEASRQPIKAAAAVERSSAPARTAPRSLAPAEKPPATSFAARTPGPTTEAPRRPDTAVAAPTVKPSSPPGIPTSAEDVTQRMRVQFLVYSDVPSERLVFIDNRRFVEGQTIQPGVVLERIEPNGAIVSHQGSRVVLRADPRASQ